jgi:5-methylcytosine-specific restriction endonuclease McrA
VPTPSPAAQLHFLNNVQRLLDEGSFVATYKYALLMALADLSVEKGNDTGDPLPIALSDIAEKFIQYYWRQVRPYPGTKHETLFQNTGQQAAIVNAVADFGRAHGPSLAKSRRSQKTWGRLVKRVAGTVEKMPLWRLQVVGDSPHIFLYGHELNDGHITLLPGVAFCFRRFHPMVVRMAQSAWVDTVRGLKPNQPILGQRKDLTEFMFGSVREPLTAYQPILLEQQAGRCFYCRRTIRESSVVDHFIPWSRYPVDLGHNFVVAHPACNSAKADHLAALSHLKAWVDRNDHAGAWMAVQFDKKGLPHDLDTTLEIAKWAYSQTEQVKGLVWEQGKNLRELRPEWTRIL